MRLNYVYAGKVTSGEYICKVNGLTKRDIMKQSTIKRVDTVDYTFSRHMRIVHTDSPEVFSEALQYIESQRLSHIIPSIDIEKPTTPPGPVNSI